MRFPLLYRFLLITVALTPMLRAQDEPRSFLAYVRVIHVDLSQNKETDACLIVGDDAQFRYEVWPSFQDISRRHDVKVYVGHFSPQVFDQFKSLVGAQELLSAHSSRSHGSMVASHDYEMVSLRIHREGESQELVFMSADNNGSMPDSARALVPWVEDLRKTLGRPNRRAEARACTGLDATPDFMPHLQKRVNRSVSEAPEG